MGARYSLGTHDPEHRLESIAPSARRSMAALVIASARAHTLKCQRCRGLRSTWLGKRAHLGCRHRWCWASVACMRMHMTCERAHPHTWFHRYSPKELVTHIHIHMHHSTAPCGDAGIAFAMPAHGRKTDACGLCSSNSNAFRGRLGLVRTNAPRRWCCDHVLALPMPS